MNTVDIKRHKKRISEGRGTLILIFINVVLFLVLNLIPNSRETFLLSPDLNKIINSPWTVVTVFFSHEIPLHIVLNMVLLFVFGRELEQIVHSKRLVALYVLAGIIGSIVIVPVSMLVGNQDLIAGASAAVMAVVGAFATLKPNFVILKSKAKNWLVALIIFSVIPVFIMPETIDSCVAHLSGIFVGVVVGLYFKKMIAKLSQQDRS